MMVTTYIKAALRNIKRHKGYSLINICGLALGMAVFILIALFLRNETSYDRFHEKHDRIFRVVSRDPGDKNSYAGTPAPLGPVMLDNFPDVSDYVRLARSGGVLKHKDKEFNERRVLMADPSLFRIFSFPLIKGSPEAALKELNSIVFTESMVRKYFGNEDPMGQIVNLNSDQDLVVTGIVEDVPESSHFHFDFLIPFERISNRENWGAWNYYTYLLLHETSSPKNVKEKFDKWAKDHGRDEIYYESLFYQPLTRIHFQYNRYNLEPAFNGKYINVFVAVAFVILVLACINFMNLSAARSS